MRSAIKLRVSFLVCAIACFWLGVHFTPETLVTTSAEILLASIAAVYFVLLPILYWFWIIKAGKQPKWKLLLIFSLSSLVARLSFPAEFASYFEFVMWVRYPLIAVLLVIELYLVVTVIRGLWQARSLKGDPRIGVVEQYDASDEKQRSLAMVLATEPANWLYAIPWFSRNHVTALAHIPLLSSRVWHLLLMLVGCIALSGISYYLIASWNDIVALIVSSIIAYSVILLVANYRVSKHYSLYIQDEKLVINNGLWGFLLVPLNLVESAEQGEFDKSALAEQLCIGRAQHFNLKLNFATDVTYFGSFGHLPEDFTQVYLAVDSPETVIKRVSLDPEDVTKQVA
ncbi:hypothetical protein [Shewanella maritima]|uniref:hypothetical protein n=1 Tax=Shewanella maritima TaxID=2520507 RepID=UPI003736824B